MANFLKSRAPSGWSKVQEAGISEHEEKAVVGINGLDTVELEEVLFEGGHDFGTQLSAHIFVGGGVKRNLNFLWSILWQQDLLDHAFLEAGTTAEEGGGLGMAW
jgi:hypothetical protein